MAGLSISSSPSITSQTNPHLLDSLDEVMESCAHKVAIKYAGRIDSSKVELTYGELNCRINDFARRMINAGVLPGEKVGLYFLNHPDYVVAFLSILKVGAVVVPINPLLKANEITHILSDSEASYLVADYSLLNKLDQAAKVISLLKMVFAFTDANSPALEESSINRVESADLGRSLAGSIDVHSKVQNRVDGQDGLGALVYTSGTTGNPKGAMLSHKNLVSAVEMKRGSFVVEPDDCVLAVLPLCHIYGMVVVMLGTLFEGATISIMEVFDAKATLHRIERDRVSILPAVPAMFQFISMELMEGTYDTASLKYCVTGGAPIDPLMRELVEDKLGAPVLEGYALTEIACVGTLTPIHGVRKGGSAGPAINGVDLKILGKNREFLPPGRQNVGEVAIAGPQVMGGYYRNPSQSLECFHNQYFLTGDLGYLDEDGYLFISGRSKELIIRGGQNIYPREIEALILKHEKVEDVAVIGVPDKFMGERVKAVIVVSPGKDLSESEIDLFCRSQLAPYKVPRIYEFRDQLPRNSTGKVLKRLL